MNVVDLHPDDLLDREARGALTAQERARLDAHLAVCVACRFERVARDDFAMEDAGEPAHARLSGPIEDVLDAALHPDDLFDREARGQLTPAERALLDAHLASCAVCRFERAVRDDFAGEAAAFEQAGGVAPLPVVAPRAAGPEVPDLAIAPAPAPVRHISSAPRSRSMGARLRIGLMAAAATFVVGAAAAAGFAGATRVFNLVPAPPPPAAPVVAPVQTTRAVGRGPVAPRTTPAPAETAAAAEPAEPAAVEAAPVAPSNAAPSPTTDPAPAIVAPAAPAPAQPALAAAQPIHVAPSGVAASPHAGVASPAVTQAPQVAAIPPIATPEQKEPVRPEPPPVASGATAASIFADANAARRSGDDARATALYRELDRRYPDSAEAKVARATLGRMLLDHGDPSAALERFDAYLEKSRGTLSEEAMIGRAEALRRLGRAAEEKATWQKFLQTYPGSPHAARARARISTLLPSIVARVRCEER